MSFRFLNIALCLLFSFNLAWSQSQNLCDAYKREANFVQGAFELNATQICSGSEIKIRNLTRHTKVSYVFDYQNQSIDNAQGISDSSTTYQYDSDKTKIFTILQIAQLPRELGSDEPQKFAVACKNVTVKASNRAVFNYEICGGKIYISIPSNPSNSFKRYDIVFSTGIKEQVAHTQIPYSKDFPYSPRMGFTVVGIPDSPLDACPSPPAFEIPQVTTNGTDEQSTPIITLAENFSGNNGYNFEINGSSTGKIDLYGYVQGNYPNTAKLLSNLSPGSNTVNIDVAQIPGNSSVDSRLCFYLESTNNCGVIQKGPQICQANLNTFSPQRYLSQVKLAWDPYPKTAGVVSSSDFGLEYEVYRNSSGQTTLVNTLPESQTTMDDNTLNCKERFCYSVKTVTRGTINGVAYTSSYIGYVNCTDLSGIALPPIDNAYVNVTDNNFAEVVFLPNSVMTPPTWHWVIYKKDHNGNFRVLDEHIDESDDSYEDILSGTVSKSESYKVGYRDECNSYAIPTKELRTIFLENNVQDIRWFLDQDSVFSYQPVQDQRVDIFDLGTQLDAPAALVDLEERSHRLDLSDFEISIRIKISTTGSDGYISNSNTIEIPIPAQVYVPTAFTPNNDGKNDEFEFFGKARQFKDLKTLVYNRNGQQIAMLDGFFEKWDGTYKGTLAPADFYIYKMVGNLLNGLTFNKSGQFLLIR